MRAQIKKLLRGGLLKEEFVTNISDTPTEYQYSKALNIAEDINDDINHYLVISVNLLPINKDLYELTFGFSIHDINQHKVGNFMYIRSDVAKYLPIDLKGKITPMVAKMRNELITKIKPKYIDMETTENLNGDSLKRYEKALQELKDIFGYVLLNTYKDATGITHWRVKKNESETIDLNETNIEHHQPITYSERKKMREDYLNKMFSDENFITELKKNTLKKI